MKSGFALFLSVVLVFIVSILSVNIFYNNNLMGNINNLKYLHLQANIHLKHIEQMVKNSTNEQIDNFSLNDTRYNVTIKQNDTNSSIYFVSVETKDDTPVRVYKKIIK